MTKPNYELLRQAYAILDGIPQEVYDLNTVVTKHGNKSVKCGTIACGIGWLSQHPKFKALGLRHTSDGLYFKRQPVSYWTAGARVFGIDEDEAGSLFRSTTAPRKTHKRILLDRIKIFLGKNGQLDYQLLAQKGITQ